MGKTFMYQTGDTVTEARDKFNDNAIEDCELFRSHWNYAEGTYNENEIILVICNATSKILEMQTSDDNREYHIYDIFLWSRVLSVLRDSGYKYITFAYT